MREGGTGQHAAGDRDDAPARVAPPVGGWRSPHDREHPLVGKWYVPQTRTFASDSEVYELFRGARYVLLGEKHDNEDHHLLQAAILRELTHRAAASAVVFEMIELGDQGRLDVAVERASAARARRKPGPSSPPPGVAEPTFDEAIDGIGAALAWDTSGWPPFAIYRPIFAVAVDRGLRLRAGNVSAVEARSIARGERLPAEKEAWLRLDEALPADLEAALRSELVASHCGHLTLEKAGPMAKAQRARDAALARALVDAAELGKRRVQGGTAAAVLIAGAGHVRRDRGVPFHLAAIDPGARVVSVAFIEVDGDVAADDRSTEAAAEAQLRAREAGFDVVLFTPRANDEDPCAMFRTKGK